MICMTVKYWRQVWSHIKWCGHGLYFVSPRERPRWVHILCKRGALRGAYCFMDSLKILKQAYCGRLENLHRDVAFIGHHRSICRAYQKLISNYICCEAQHLTSSEIKPSHFHLLSNVDTFFCFWGVGLVVFLTAAL